MKILGRLLAACGLVCLVCLVVLLGTEVGLNIIHKSVTRFYGGSLSVEGMSGRLFGCWTVSGIRVATPGADVEVARLAWDWQPGELAGGDFHVAGLAVEGVKITLKDHEEVPADTGPIELPEVLLPFALAVDRFAVDRIQLFDSDGSELIIVDHIGGRLEGRGESLTISDFSLEAPGIGFSVHGNLNLGRNPHIDLLGGWWVSDYGFHPIGGTFSLLGPLDTPKVTFAVNRSGLIQVEGKVVNLLKRPEWTATVTAWNVDFSVLIEDCPEIQLATFKGQVAGDTSGYRGRARAVVDWGRQKAMHLDTTLTADWMGIVFDTLGITSGNAAAVADGSKISWRDIFDWQGHFRFKNFDPSVFSEKLQGRINADFFNRGDVSERGDVEDDFGVDVSFRIASLDGHLHGQPISAEGNLRLTENDIRSDGLTLHSGEVEGVAYLDKGMISWDDQVSWSGALRLANFNPAGLFPDFPGQINGEFSGEGRFADSGPEGYLKISNISGLLRGQGLAGEGEIHLAGETLRTTGLFVRSGFSELVVEGQAGDAFALDFTFSSPDIGVLLPDGSGDVEVRASLRGSRAKPMFAADFEGTGLRIGDSRFGEVRAEIEAGLWEEGVLRGTFAGEEMVFAGLSIAKGRIDFTGSRQAQEIAVDMTGAPGELKMKAVAEYREKWQGELTGLQLNLPAYGLWRQQQAAPFVVGKDGMMLDTLCVADGEGRICAGGEVQMADALRWQVEGNLADVPLSWLNRLKLLRLPASGFIDAEISANGDSRNISSARVKVNLPEMGFDLEMEDEELSSVHFDETLLSMQLSDAQLRAEFSTRMKNGSRVRAVADISGAGDFAVPVHSLPLKGGIDLNNFDIAVLSAFTGYGVEPTGRVNSSFVLGGTIGQPQLSGESRIEGGGIALPYQGITLENVTASIVAGEDGAKIDCRTTSGPGELKVDGTLRYGDKGVEGELQVRGKDFLLVDLPEYTFRVTPDLLFRFNRDKGEISGLVKVPYGLITPEEMNDAIQASEDVILVNGKDEIKGKGWPFPLDLDVQVGDDVRIDGYGLTGRLTGQLRIKTTRDALLTGKGELDVVEGAFAIYGRSFDIERGRVLFTGGPIDNPGVDVRAQKKVSEEEAKGAGYTVGVDISGLVQNLQYQLFSDPYMDDTEILSMMIVGHSLANSSQEEGNLLEAAAVTLGLKGSAGFMQGLGNMIFIDDMHLEGSSKKENVSLVVGKRVTKDLYIGYDMNMFSQLGQFRVRYDLQRGFSVETHSSSQSTGADLLYSFER
jgi:translocation and assembly module TamB